MALHACHITTPHPCRAHCAPTLQVGSSALWARQSSGLHTWGASASSSCGPKPWGHAARAGAALPGAAWAAPGWLPNPCRQQARGVMSAARAPRRAGAGGGACACGSGVSISSGGGGGPWAPRQAQQWRGLLGKPSAKPKKIKYQDHNQTKPKTTKI